MTPGYHRVEDVYGDFLELDRCETCYAWVDPLFMTRHKQRHKQGQGHDEVHEETER